MKVGLVLLWVAACDKDATDGDSGVAEVGIGDVVVEIDPDHSTVVHVSFTTDSAAESFVRFGEDGVLSRVTPTSGAGTEHVHQLLGNKAGRSLTLQPIALVGGEEVAGKEVTVSVPQVPLGVPKFTVTSSMPGSQVAGGYAVLTFEVGTGENPQHYLGILDGEGDWVWIHPVTANYGTSAVYASLDGGALVWPEYDNFRVELDGYITKMELDGDVISRTVAPNIHHALAQLSDGRYAYLGREFIPTTPAETGGQWLMTDTVVLIPEGDDGSNAETLFSYYQDWWGGDIGQYWLAPCHQQFNSLFGYPQLCELTHTNSIAAVVSEGAIYAYPRLLDTLLKIDVQTGELLWQMGGMYSDFTFPNGDPLYLGESQSFLWSQGHFSQIWPGGMMMFDNGVNYVPSHSGLAEYGWDEAAFTVSEVWRYDDPLGGYTYALGDARRLSSGSVLASWMSIQKLTEIGDDGAELWHVDTAGTNVRRLFFLESLYDLQQMGESLPPASLPTGG